MNTPTKATAAPPRRPRPAPVQADPVPVDGDANGSEHDDTGAPLKRGAKAAQVELSAKALALANAAKATAANGSEHDDTLGLLIGAQAIADYRGEKVRRTMYLLETGQIPGFKHAGRWCSTKATQRADVARLEREAGQK